MNFAIFMLLFMTIMVKAQVVTTCKEDSDCNYSPGQCCSHMWGADKEGKIIDMHLCFDRNVIEDNKGRIRY